MGRPVTSAVMSDLPRTAAAASSTTLCDRRLALGALLGDALGDVAIGLGIEVAQTQVLEVPLDLPDAEAVRDRRVDLERLAGDRLLLGRRQARQRPHVVQAVGELDDDDADVLGHRHEHLAQVLDLRVFLRLVGDARELGDALDERGDLGAELRGDLFARDDGVLDDVVQERGGDRRPVHLQVGQDRGDRERVLDVGLARGAQLALVGSVGERRRRARSQPRRAVGSYDCDFRIRSSIGLSVVGISGFRLSAIDAAGVSIGCGPIPGRSSS